MIRKKQQIMIHFLNIPKHMLLHQIPLAMTICALPMWKTFLAVSLNSKLCFFLFFPSVDVYFKNTKLLINNTYSFVYFFPLL